MLHTVGVKVGFMLQNWLSVKVSSCGQRQISRNAMDTADFFVSQNFGRST